jgi:hypothetical protein
LELRWSCVAVVLCCGLEPLKTKPLAALTEDILGVEHSAEGSDEITTVRGSANKILEGAKGQRHAAWPYGLAEDVAGRSARSNILSDASSQPSSQSARTAAGVNEKA